jgi:Bacterial tandem repeat domain 1/Peptidase family M23
MKALFGIPVLLLGTLFFLQQSRSKSEPIKSSGIPDISVVDVQPINSSGDVVYLTCAPETAGGNNSALLSVYFKIKNNEGKQLTLKKIEYQYTTNGTSKVFPFSPGKDNSNETINNGATFNWQNKRGYNELGNVIEINGSLPSQINIRLYFDGYDSPYVITKNIKAHVNAAAYSFPGKESDLGINEYWYGEASHGGGPQVFSYDIVMVGWDEKSKKWSTKYPGAAGDKNEHFRCFGRPVYAIADGEVVKFNDKIKDNEPGIDTDGGGNTFHIKIGNEIIRYYHLKQFSLNKEFMKIGAKVKRGDWLARVGSTATAGTHLHIDCISADNPEAAVVWPLQFTNTSLIAFKNLPEPSPDAAWIKVNKTGLPYIADGLCVIWPGNKPTWYPGGKNEIAKHGIEENKYQQEFNKIWGSGYYPVWIDAYDVAGKTFFNTVFRYNSNNYDVAVKHDMTKESFQTEYDDWVKKKGYRLQQIDNYNDAGKLKLAAIFIKKTGQPQAQPAYHSLSPEQHQTLFEKYTGDGFVPVNVSVASVGGKKYYSAFYEKRNVGGSVLKSSLSQQEYQDKYDEMKGKNWEQVYINAYKHDGQTMFSVIWYEKSGFRDYSATRKSDNDSYQNKWENNTGNGLLTRCVTGYDEGGKHWFAAHWAK